jgi:hypothetical protein
MTGNIGDDMIDDDSLIKRTGIFGQIIAPTVRLTMSCISHAG